MDLDLVAALAQLGPGEDHELQPSTSLTPSIVVQVCPAQEDWLQPNHHRGKILQVSLETFSHSDCDQLLPCRPGVLRDSTHWRTRAPHITAEFYYQLSELSSVDLPRPQYSCIYTGFYVNKYRNREILLNNTRYRQNLRYEILRLVTAPILIWKYDEYEIRLRL